jgi:hypothetical protein
LLTGPFRDERFLELWNAAIHACKIDLNDDDWELVQGCGSVDKLASFLQTYRAESTEFWVTGAAPELEEILALLERVSQFLRNCMQSSVSNAVPDGNIWGFFHLNITV